MRKLIVTIDYDIPAEYEEGIRMAAAAHAWYGSTPENRAEHVLTVAADTDEALMELISAGLTQLCQLGVDVQMEQFDFDPTEGPESSVDASPMAG